ncbi:MAG: TIM barrel protein [Caldilineaceae bacterium]
MSVMQSICYPLFMPKEMPLAELMQHAAEIGYAAIELWGRPADFEEIMALAKAHKLAVASMSGHGSLPDGLNKRSNHDRIEAELRTSIDIAAHHGIPGLICFSGNRQPHMSDVEAIEAVADGLRRIAPYAEARNKSQSRAAKFRVDHPGYQCDHTAWGWRSQNG